ncbi:MAG TPA: hypothetical protein VGX23_15265 [Actinocrinis sp.]|nr:hypothetical protein [Actinocrinis sp.]
MLQRTLLPPVLANVPGLDVAAYYRRSKGRRPVASRFSASF